MHNRTYGDCHRRWCCLAPASRETARLLLVILAASLLLGGCTKLGPDFVKPEAQVREEWTETGEEEIEPQPVDYREWWSLFNDPVVEELVAAAYRQNLTLQEAGVRVLRARAELGIAVGSLYPQTQQADGEATTNRTSQVRPNSRGADKSFGLYDLGASVAWELDFWGRFRRGVESADATLYASIADYDDVLVLLVQGVVGNYILARTAEEQIVLAKRNVQIQRRSLEIAQVRFRNGVVTELDVQQAIGLLRETQSTVPRFEADLRAAENALSVLLGRPPGEVRMIMKGAGKIPTAPPEVAVGVPADLLRRRPDVRRAELAAAAQSARIGVARTDLFPRLSLIGTIGTQSTSGAGRTTDRGEGGLDSMFTSDSLRYQAGPAFTWNLFNYGRLKNNVRVQDAAFQEAVVFYQNQVLEAAGDVETFMTDFLRSQEQAAFLADAVKAQQRAVDLALIQYRDGVVDYQRVLDTQRALVASEQDWTDSRGNIGTSLVNMYAALGGGWELREGKPFVPEHLQSAMADRTDWGKLLKPDAMEKVPEKQEDFGEWRWPDW
ncbi:MAG: efflux transporter outer membrane subunit [Gammaproteobacteria bacterium]|nr:efflux transporter outer membrane subunit [Gammaproteobacteria bacterium]MDJ0889617.1 efflux transporter outer membrane subunit [Gammaproteobacteria bacterium]